MKDNDIIVSRQDFDIKDTLTCGQLFRYQLFDNYAEIYSLDKKAILYNRNANEIVIENEDKEYFSNYFDLQTDYSAIKQALTDKPFMADAIEFGSGIRILRQDIYETIISFIISANNNIPRIQGIINRLCNGEGFPTAKELAEYSENDFKKIGLGYRASYLVKTTATLLSNDFDINYPNTLNGLEANKYLTSKLTGVGPKVADCILLFGYHKMDVFPVDTWIKKVYSDIFGDNVSPQKMREKLINTYGEYSGYAQQYLFYNKREDNK